VFTALAGGLLDLHNWRADEWYPALEAAGVAQRGPYHLRHTFATRALAAGITLFELSRYMGTSIEMIDRHYGHLAQGNEQAAAAKLDALDAAAHKPAAHVSAPRRLTR
jgi:integrase